MPPMRILALPLMLALALSGGDDKQKRPKLSVKASVKVNIASAPGVVKVGLISVALLRATGGPPICVQPVEPLADHSSL